MRNAIFLIVSLFLFTACSNKEVQKSSIKQIKQKQRVSKNHYYIEEFIYKKEQIEFFEKDFENVLILDDKKLLEKFASFYKSNASYFKNSSLKVSLLEKRIKQISNENIEDEHKILLTKALSSSKKEALSIYEKLAHNENIFAQRELAEIYKYENKLKSIFWYKKLIQNNDIKSIKEFAFANLHMISPVVVQDTKKAIALYEKLDSLGEVSGLVHLGNIYEHGYFKNEVSINKVKALNYFEKAAAKDYTPAQKKLVKIYLCEKCKGNRYNKEKGLKLLNILVNKGDEESKELLVKLSSKEPIKEEVIQEEKTQTPKIEESVE